MASTKDIAQALNVQNVVDPRAVKPELLCSICQQVLVQPLQCSKCKQKFHEECLDKFLAEVGHCPSLCLP